MAETSVFEMLGVAIDPARASEIAADLAALAARVRCHDIRPAIEDEPCGFARQQVAGGGAA